VADADVGEHKMKKKITIDGMHCASCSSNVERSLKKIPEIKEVSISLMTKKAIIETEGEIPEEDLRKAVTRAGYKVVSIE
jgi:P-type Cu+ transporter